MKPNGHGSMHSSDRDSLTRMPVIHSGRKNVNFTGSVADVLSDTEYQGIVGRSYTGGDTIVLSSVTTGVNTALVPFYAVDVKRVRCIQVGTAQNITMDVRYAIIVGQ